MSSQRQNWRQKWRSLFAGLLHGAPANQRAWASALPALREMDSRLLDDVGAPQWVHDAVRRQCDERAHAIEQILAGRHGRSEEHTSELQSLMRISYAVFCLKKKKTQQKTPTNHHTKIMI